MGTAAWGLSRHAFIAGAIPAGELAENPDVLDWNNLNKYAEMFKTTESGGQGQLLDGDPSFVTNDEALVKNLNLNYKVVYAGSEAALTCSSPSKMTSSYASSERIHRRRSSRTLASGDQRATIGVLA